MKSLEKDKAPRDFDQILFEKNIELNIKITLQFKFKKF